MSGVGKYLIRQGIRSRNGKPYSLLGIKEILQNPVYCIADQDALRYFQELNADVCFDEEHCSDKLGLLSYNKRDYKKKSAPRQPIEKWIIAVGKHKGIITGKEWTAIQDALTGAGNHENRLHNDYALLSGLIYCTKCKEKLFSKPRSNNPALFDYMCASKIRGGMEVCDCKNINGKQADDMVCGWLLDYVHEDSDIFTLLEKLKKELLAQEPVDPMQALEKQIAERGAEIDNLVKSLSHPNVGEMLLQKINERTQVLDGELKDLNEALRLAKNNREKAESRELELAVMANTLSSFKEYFTELTMPEKRLLIRLVIQRIEWDGADLDIFVAK